MTLLALFKIDTQTQLVDPIVSTVVIGVVAIALLFISVWLMEKLSPFSLRKEIEDDHNVSAAIVVAAIVIGVSLVIASVAQG
jgi:putative membrane protein